MCYNQYLYRLPVQAVPITDIVKNSISSADIVTDPIIGTSLHLCIPKPYLIIAGVADFCKRKAIVYTEQEGPLW